MYCVKHAQGHQFKRGPAISKINHVEGVFTFCQATPLFRLGIKCTNNSRLNQQHLISIPILASSYIVSSCKETHRCKLIRQGLFDQLTSL